MNEKDYMERGRVQGGDSPALLLFTLTISSSNYGC